MKPNLCKRCKLSMFSWHSQTRGGYQSTQNTTPYSMENLENGKSLHFAYLINQDAHRFQDILERSFSLFNNCISHFGLQFPMLEVSINIITYTSTCYIKFKLTIVKLSKLISRNYFLYNLRTPSNHVLIYYKCENLKF